MCTCDISASPEWMGPRSIATRLRRLNTFVCAVSYFYAAGHPIQPPFLIETTLINDPTYTSQLAGVRAQSDDLPKLTDRCGVVGNNFEM